MTLPTLDERQNGPQEQSVSNRKKALLNEARANALRANLKKRKEQSNSRLAEIEQEDQTT